MLRAPAAIPTAAAAWAAPQAAFGGPARVAMLDALLSQLRSCGVLCVVCSFNSEATIVRAVSYSIPPAPPAYAPMPHGP